MNSGKSIIYFIIFSLCFNLQIKAQKNEGIAITSKPSWVKKYPFPKIESDYDSDLALLQVVDEYNHETQESYKKLLYYLNNKEGVNKINSSYFYYEPEYQKVSLNSVKFHRDDKTITLTNNLHVENIIYEKQIGVDFYTNDGKVKIFYEGATVGDVIELSYTIKGKQPDIGESLWYSTNPYYYNLQGHCYTRILNRKPISYKSLNWTPKITRSKLDGLHVIEFDVKKDKHIDYTETPEWYTRKKNVYFFDNLSWKNYVQLNLKNFKLDKVPSSKIINKVRDLTKLKTSKHDKINSILNYVQKEIHYLDYDLVEPKQPDIVMKQGFGDCKSKSLLTIKMLETLDIDAWPLIVKSGGIDERLLNVYSGQMFDHVVVEFKFNNKTHIFDPTKVPQNGIIEDKTVSDFRYGLRIKKGTSEPIKLDWKSNSSIEISTTIFEHDEDGSISEKYHISSEVKLKGELANSFNWVYHQKGESELFDRMMEDVFKYPFRQRNNYEKKYSVDNSQPFSVFNFTSKKPTEKLESVNDRSDEISYMPFLIEGWSQMDELNISNFGEYISLPYLERTNYLLKIKKMEWMDITTDSMKLENDWLKYSKKTWIDNDTVKTNYSIEFLKKHLDASRYDEVLQSIDSIRNNASVILTKEKKTREDYNLNKEYQKKTSKG